MSSTLTTEPFPASRKVYVTGSHPSIRVPMREINLTPTQGPNGEIPTPNPPVTVYDPSGPYTDSDVSINVRKGLHPLRREWVFGRNDVEELPEVSSIYGRKRSTDTSLDAIQICVESQAASCQIWHECDANALCAQRHRDAGNGIYCHSRESNS